MNEGALVGWAVLFFGLILPMAHVIVSPRSGRWLPGPGSRCPFGPRVGWIVLIIMLGPIGWLMYMRKRNRPPAPRAKA
ncbi:MAG: hypothetical protein EXQ86_09675 [Rhodospirillales bacterium]|nr:hypothetical protein [Rhodospirillales bacterium]